MKIRKKVIPIMLSLLMILTLLPIAVPVQALSSSGFAGGTGTVEDPYQIATADQLKRVRWCMYNNSTPNSFILTADITLSASDNWTPIGSTGTNDAFAGTFDGNWHTISNVNIVGTSDTYYGFFGYVSRPAVIRNLKLINVSVSANSSVAVGGLIGTARNLFQSGSGSGCLIENCYVQGTVSNLGGGATGALVGCLYSASSYTHTVSGCCAEVTVSGGNYVSGLVGEANYTSISDCCAMDPVTATGNYVGGLVGELYNSSSITNSYAIGAVTCTGAGTDVGGLIGYTSWSTVTNSYYNSENTEQSDTDKGTPKTTAEMTTATTYSDWSSDIWNITDSAYPVLKSFDSTAYLVTYNLNGGSGTTPTETEKSAFETFTAASSDGLTPPSSPAGMVFKEWNTEPDGSGAAYASCAQVGMPPNSLTLYAIWALQYTVTYEANGGDYAPLDGNVYFAGDICTVASSASMTVPDGMMFQEWNTKDDGSGTTYYGNQGFSMPSSNVTLFAIWETLQNGSEAYPYLVNDDTDLDKVSHYNNSGVHFRQTADITLPSGWQPIGDSSDPFLGIYDGGGYTISGLTINDDAGSLDYVGIFGYVDAGAQVKNLQIADAEVVSSSSSDGVYVGALVGYNEGTIENCGVSGSVYGQSDAYVGGIAAYNAGTITSCDVDGNIYVYNEEDAYVGGIAAYNQGTITGCSASGFLADGDGVDINGIAGYNAGTIENCTDNTCIANSETLYFNIETGCFYRGNDTEPYELDGWSYDSDNGILTLNNVTWTTIACDALDIYGGDLMIKTAAGSTNSFISFESGEDGIYMEDGTLTLGGSGTLVARCSSAEWGTGIYSDYDLVVTGGTIISSGSDSAVYVNAVTDKNSNLLAYNTTPAILEASTADGVVTDLSTISFDPDNWGYTDGGGNWLTYVKIGTAPSSGNTGSSDEPTYSAKLSTASGSQTSIPITVNSTSGNASVRFSRDFISDGTVISVPSISGVGSYSVGIPVSNLSTSDAQGALSFDTDVGTVTVPSNMLTGVPDLSGSNGNITIGQGDKDHLPDDVKAAIGDRPLIQLTLSIDGKQTDWSNPDVPVTVSIPYTPSAEELANQESIVVWYIDGSGNLVAIPNGQYDPATGTVTFSITHFSQYAVGYNNVTFGDVPENAWYYDAVSFLAARGITSGTSNTTFSPNATLTRGQFITLLMRAYGIDPDDEFSDNFSDAGNTYYTGYLAAAKRLGIASGVGNNQFAPQQVITRQEMFTLLYHALDVMDRLPGGDSGKTIADFTDSGSIASYAREAMAYLVKIGAVSGNNGQLSPTATTTRAQMVQVLYSLLEK